MNVIMIGASGLIGSLCLRKLASQPSIKKIYSISRKPLAQSYAQLEERVGPLAHMRELCAGVQGQAAICCLGTTMKKAGSREAFTEIDLQLPLAFAQAMREQGVKNFCLVSSMGAAPRSRNFYLRTKGQLEESLGSLEFEALHIFRPSFLLGERQEKRWGELVAGKVFQSIEAIFPERLVDYKPIAAETVADCIVEKALQPSSGSYIWDNRYMLTRSR